MKTNLFQPAGLLLLATLVVPSGKASVTTFDDVAIPASNSTSVIVVESGSVSNNVPLGSGVVVLPGADASANFTNFVPAGAGSLTKGAVSASGGDVMF